MTLLFHLGGLRSFLCWTHDHVRVVLGVGARVNLRVHDCGQSFYLRHCFIERANVGMDAAFLFSMPFEVCLGVWLGSLLWRRQVVDEDVVKILRISCILD